mmetsp:Transcript_26367/g.84485  ORF Transcript_26367/g.84485 Transcript_26367/m.84485 type:complete len:283 (-) Transcript_26367:693-1541(-)
MRTGEFPAAALPHFTPLFGYSLFARAPPNRLRHVCSRFHCWTGALAILQDVPEEEWATTKSKGMSGSATHRFQGAAPCDNEAVKRGLRLGSGLERSVALLFRALGTLAPIKTRHNFQLGMYSRGDHIGAHDDRAYHDVEEQAPGGGRGKVIKQYSRDIAVIFYLTKEWEESYGGLLVDGQTGDVYVPEFNSIVAFYVPRTHEVTPLAVARPRYSVFGWFLSPEDLYKRPDGGDGGRKSKKRRGEGRAGGAGALDGEEDGAGGGPRPVGKRKWRIPMALTEES